MDLDRRMGLGLLIDASIPPRGWRKRQPSAIDFLTRLEEACRDAVSDQLLRRFVHVTPCSEADGGIDVRLHPGAAAVEFRIEADRVTAIATTTPAGPGYHAFVVDWLDRVGERVQLEWCWDDHGGGEGDECGYHEATPLGSALATDQEAPQPAELVVGGMDAGAG